MTLHLHTSPFDGCGWVYFNPRFQGHRQTPRLMLADSSLQLFTLEMHVLSASRVTGRKNRAYI